MAGSHRIGIGLLVVVLLLGLVVAMLWVLQRELIYFPDAAPVPPAGDIIAGARDVSLHTADGLDLDAWFIPAVGDLDLGVAVLVAPGNAGNRAGRAGFAQELSRYVSVPVHFQDERLSSFGAREKFVDTGLPKAKRRELLDALAAAEILQSFLDGKANP